MDIILTSRVMKSREAMDLGFLTLCIEVENVEKEQEQLAAKLGEFVCCLTKRTRSVLYTTKLQIRAYGEQQWDRGQDRKDAVLFANALRDQQFFGVLSSYLASKREKNTARSCL